MMTKFLASSFAGLLELFMWVSLLWGILVGIGSELSGNIFLDGAIGLIAMALLSALFFGPILLLVEIKNRLRNIETRLTQRNSFSPKIEPTFSS